MKILIVGRKSMYNAEFFYEKAFRKLGHDVLLVDSYNKVSHELMKRQIHTRTAMFDFSLGRYWVNNHLPEIVDSFDPDAIVFFKGDFVSNFILKELSESRNIYLFYPDTYKFKSLLRNRLYCFKNVFTAANETRLYYDLGAKNVVTVPWACDPNFHRKLDLNKKYVTSFVGTAYPERRKVIRKLGNVDVFGDFWYGFGNKYHESVHGENFVRTINQSSINLNLQAKVSVKSDAPTMRTFELACCGGFQISDYMPSLKRYFPLIPTFKDMDELREMIKFYIDNKNERSEISLKCMEICRNSYKYTDSAKLMLAKL
jgi:spore maturation protein CgeB